MTDRQAVLDALAEVYTPEGMEIWMRSANRALKGQVPDEMIENGQAGEVLDLIDALASGAVL